MDEEQDMRVAVEEEPVAPPPPAPVRVISFEQWALNHGIPTTHFRGMKAFVSNPSRPRTEAAWDAAFANY